MKTIPTHTYLLHSAESFLRS